MLKYLFNSDYRYFVQKRKGVHKMILDYEFKRFKTLELREGVRDEANTMKQRLDVLLANIKKEEEAGGLKEKNPDEFKRMQDQQVLLERDIKRREEQLAAIDIEVNGAPPTTEDPQGTQGINQTIDALRDFDLLIRDYANAL